MTSDNDYAGLRLLVTGGGSGIGHAVATAALARGAVVTVVDLDPSTAPTGAIAQRADFRSEVVAESPQVINRRELCRRCRAFGGSSERNEYSVTARALDPCR